MFDVKAPTSPMLQKIKEEDGKVVFFKMVYNDECDEFIVDEVVKYDIETGEKVED